MAMIDFWQGLKANLPVNKSEGRVYVVTDENSLYLDIDDATRIRIGISVPDGGTVEMSESLGNGPYTFEIAEDEEELQPYTSNPNLLDNWYFTDPINQRGKTEYTGEGYTIDRWRQQDPVTIRLDAESIHYSVATGANSGFVQPSELSLAGKKMTLSVLMKGSGEFVIGQWLTGSLPGAGTLSNKFSITDDWNVYTFTTNAWADPATNHIGIWCLSASGGEADIKAIKLELGDTQTLAHQDADGSWVLNDPPPNKQQELAKC